MYVNDAGKVIEAVYSTLSPPDDWHFESDGTLSWNAAEPKPTEQEIADYANDVTPLPNGQLFSEWLAEHGGDTILTAKRKAKEIHESQDDLGRIIRAIVLLLVDGETAELNVLRTWLRDFQTVIANANNLAEVKTGVAGLPALADRTAAQAKTAINNIIDGE